MRKNVRGVGLLAMAAGWSALLLPIAGCGSFFQCQGKASCPTTGTGTGTGTGSTVNYAYAAYTTVAGTGSSATVSAYVQGYNIAGGALTALPSVSLPVIPVAIAVSPNNAFLYVASLPGSTNPGVYGYSIGSTGALTALNNGSPYFTDLIGAMAISPDGQYLYTVNVTGQYMLQYGVNASTGALTQGTQLPLPALNCALSVGTPATQSCSVAVSPAKNYVVASLGTAGDVVYAYATGTGVTSATPVAEIAAAAQSGDYSVAIDANSNAYLSQTLGVTVYGLTTTPPTNRGTATVASGVVPRGIVTDPDSKFVFTANEGTGTIASYTTGTANALNGVTGSPFPGPAHVSALGVDSTDSYLVSVGYDASAGIQLWSVAASGVIARLASAGTTTATQYPVLVAMSH